VEKWVVEFNDCARRQASDMGLSHDQQQAFLQRLLKDNIAQVHRQNNRERKRTEDKGLTLSVLVLCCVCV
jgi:hypothetical protein